MSISKEDFSKIKIVRAGDGRIVKVVERSLPDGLDEECYWDTEDCPYSDDVYDCSNYS